MNFRLLPVFSISLSSNLVRHCRKLNHNASALPNAPPGTK